MSLKSENHKKKKGRPFGSITRFPGLVSAARLLNRSPHHLRQVLLGQRTSPELLAALMKSGHPLSKSLSN